MGPSILLCVLLGMIGGCTSSATEDRWDLDAYFDGSNSSSHSQERIVGGNNIPAGEFVKYQISIQYLRNGTYRHFCGGSIIAPNRILTAAHCVVGQVPERLTILAGVRDLNATDGTRTQVTKIDTHSDYIPLKSSDIAILSIDPPLVIDGKHMDVINVDYTDEVDEDELTILTGWGSTRHSRTSPSYPNILQTLSYQTMNNLECKRKIRTVTETEICAKSLYGTGACAGDSGGPLAMTRNGKLMQVGIVSYGRRKCGSDGLDVYTRVSMFNEWIKERTCSE